MLFALAAAAFTFGLVTALAAEIETLDPTNRRGDVDSVIYAAPRPGSTEKQVLATVRGDESRVLVGSDEIADVMKQAIVVVEDKRFYEHNGVDPAGETDGNLCVHVRDTGLNTHVSLELTVPIFPPNKTKRSFLES